MGAAVITALLAPLILAGVFSYEGDLRQEARATWGSHGVDELETVPKLEVRFDEHRWRTTAAYEPHLVLRRGKGEDVSVLHRGSASGSSILSGAWRATGSALGSIGRKDLLVERTRAGPADATSGTVPEDAGQPLPLVTTMRRASVVVSGAATGRIGSRSQLSVGSHLALDLALDNEARAALSRFWNGALTLGHGWIATGRDEVISAVSFGVARSPLTTSVVAALSERLTHDLGRSREAWFQAGPVLTATRDSGQTSWRGRGSGEVGIQGAILPARLRGSAVARVAPAVDRLTNVLLDRLDGSAALSWTVAPTWVTGVAALGGVVVSGEQAGQTVATGHAWITYSPKTGGWAASVGGSRMVQAGGPSQVPDLRVWTGFVIASYARRGRM